MNTINCISHPVDSWTREQDLPPSAALKIIRLNDPNHGLTEDEIQDRNEFIRCYILSNFELLMMIPKQAVENDFFIPDVDVFHEEYSAFNTVDFQRTQMPFDKYGYAMKKIMERVKELAIIHSSVSSQDSRDHTYQRYEALVEIEFRYRMLDLVKEYKNTFRPERRYIIKQKIGELNRRIMECRRMWERYAPPSVWDN